MAASSGLLQGVGVCAGMCRVEGLRLGAAGVRRGQGGGGEGNVPSEKVPHSLRHTQPNAKCLPGTRKEVITLFSQEETDD